MKFIDTHTHIYTEEFDTDRSETIQRAKASGIAAILLPNEDTKSIDRLLKLCDEEPNFAYPMIGLHPTSINEDYILELKQLEKSLTKRKYYAIGEIGMDLYWDKSHLKQQKEAFIEQLKWSIDLNLPISIHTRNALDEVLDCIYNVGTEKLKGVFHCFSGTTEEWTKISQLPSFAIGIGGTITYKKSKIPEILPKIPIERIVLETDAPYLSPSPHRGKRNEPSFVIETAKKVAECYKMTLESVATATFKNSLNMFNI